MTKSIAVLDWVVTVAFLVFGIWAVVAQWPNPDWWSWLLLVGGVVGVPLNLFNPMQRVRKFMLRKLIRR